MGPPHPSGTPHGHLWAPLGTPGYPRCPWDHGGGVRLPSSATQRTIIQLLFQFFSGVRNSGWEGLGSKQLRRTQSFSIRQAFRPVACEILTDVLQILVPRLFVPLI